MTTLCLIRHHHVKFLCFLHQFSIQNQCSFACSLVKHQEKYVDVISKVQKVMFYSYDLSWMFSLFIRYENKYFDTYYSVPFWNEFECCRCNFSPNQGANNGIETHGDDYRPWGSNYFSIVFSIIALYLYHHLVWTNLHTKLLSSIPPPPDLISPCWKYNTYCNCNTEKWIYKTLHIKTNILYQSLIRLLQNVRTDIITLEFDR